VSYNINKSHIIYKGKIFNLRQDEVCLPNGKTLHADIVDHRDSVTILPIDEKGNIWFIRQYRYPVKQELLELPAGVMEPNESPEASAQREMREEIGMRAQTLEKICEFFLAPGYSTEYMHLFLASDLIPDTLPQDTDEFLFIEKIPRKKAFQMAQKGAFQDAKTLVALVISIPVFFKEQIE
jgi:ADP-ribose pyrophosphatase